MQFKGKYLQSFHWSIFAQCGFGILLFISYRLSECHTAYQCHPRLYGKNISVNVLYWENTINLVGSHESWKKRYTLECTQIYIAIFVSKIWLIWNYLVFSDNVSVVQVVARWIIDHYHLTLNLGVAISEGCFILDLASLHLEVGRWPKNINLHLWKLTICSVRCIVCGLMKNTRFQLDDETMCTCG